MLCSVVTLLRSIPYCLLFPSQKYYYCTRNWTWASYISAVEKSHSTFTRPKEKSFVSLNNFWCINFFCIGGRGKYSSAKLPETILQRNSLTCFVRRPWWCLSSVPLPFHQGPKRKRKTVCRPKIRKCCFESYKLKLVDTCLLSRNTTREMNSSTVSMNDTELIELSKHYL